MRECWVNVYCSTRVARCGPGYESRELAAANVPAAAVSVLAYRLHVRLKPEPVGAAAFEASLYRV